MAQKNLRSKFITFEGSEGCGKSTQSRLLYNFLKRKGYKVIYLREPGVSTIGEKIRHVLLDCRNKSITPECEMLLYMAARAQLVSEVIEPVLRRGETVICDRFLDSTVAYQGYGLGMDLGLINYIGKFVTRGISPDLTIFLDIEPSIGLRRVGEKDRIERRPLSYHQRVRNGYLKISRSEPDRFKIIKLEDHKSDTQSKIRKLVERCLLIK